jgi:hypothetical protein
MEDRPRCEKRVIVEPTSPQSTVGSHRGHGRAEPGGQRRTTGDNEARGQRPFPAIDLGRETAGLGFHTAEATGSKPVTPTSTNGFPAPLPRVVCLTNCRKITAWMWATPYCMARSEPLTDPPTLRRGAVFRSLWAHEFAWSALNCTNA